MQTRWRKATDSYLGIGAARRKRTLILSRYGYTRCFCIYNGIMVSPLSTRRRSKTPPPGETGQEALYLRSLSDRQITVLIKLRDGETVRGWIEYFDDSMVRLTREGHPNLFIYKHQIRSISEAGKKRAPRTAGVAGPAMNGAAS
jgi:host factor-I protein